MQFRRGARVNLVHFCASPVDALPAPTVQIVGPSGEAILSSTAAVRDVTAASIVTGLAGARTITVSTVAGFVVGRVYVVASPDGLTSTLRLVAISSTAVSLTFDSEIPYTSTSGAVSSQILSVNSVDLPDTTYRDARIIWSYSSASESIEEVQTVDIVRRPFALDVTEQLVSEAESSFVDVSSRRPGRHIEQAKVDVENWLRSQQIMPDLVRDRSMLEQACVWRACMLRYFGSELRELCRAEYEAALAQFKTSKSWVEEAEDNENKGADATTPRPKYLLVG